MPRHRPRLHVTGHAVTTPGGGGACLDCALGNCYLCADDNGGCCCGAVTDEPPNQTPDEVAADDQLLAELGEALREHGDAGREP
jgi:glycine/D-amino acid oxidase-like deaminating enzyme